MYTAWMELFSSPRDIASEPLASRMRPRTLDEFAGQDHIVGPGRLLRRAIQADQLSSLIFYGPPGTGKTTLARIIANTTKSSFVTLNAVLSGVKDIRAAIEDARQQKDLYSRRTILFVDEVHRWNKAQQDALLPWVENGTVVLIGATTENPYFEVNSALVSRSRIFQLKTLTRDDLGAVARRTLKDPERGYGAYKVDFEEGALDHLVNIAEGDARSLLNALELAVETTPATFPPKPGETIHISLEAAEESIQKRVVLYDKEGDYHFDTISAFIKSLRGSDPDAALYWMARMIRAGEDPKFIFRRMLILASEDVGLADPNALVVTEAAAASYDRVGLPEGQFHLAQAALYLATAPKSNSSLGYFDALKSVEQEQQDEVPNHLKDANRDKKGFGHGEGYLYPHAYKEHWTAQQYLPKGLRGTFFYEPSMQGYEKKVHTEVLRRREIQMESALDTESAEILTFSPGDSEKDRWLDRILQGRSKVLEALRNLIFSAAPVSRHHRIFVANAGKGFLLWEALRRVPEGGVWGCAEPEDIPVLQEYTSSLTDLDRPVLLKGLIQDLSEKDLADALANVRFEGILGCNVFTKDRDKKMTFQKLYITLAAGGHLVIAEIIPKDSQRLSSLLKEDSLEKEQRDILHSAEQEIYHNKENTLVNWDADTLAEACRQAGFNTVNSFLHTLETERLIRKKDLSRWFSAEEGTLSYGSALVKIAGPEQAKKITSVIVTELMEKQVEWVQQVCVIDAVK